jgi:hypothetical protein
MHLFLKFIFEMKLLHVSDSSSVHRQEFFTIHTAMVYRFADNLQAGSGWNSWRWTEELSETCRVSFQK